MNADQRIVVGVDGSAFPTKALHLAGRLARRLDAPLEEKRQAGE